jgi:hypothetical protein
MAHLAMQHNKEAIAAMERANALGATPLNAGPLGYAYATSGRPHKARAVLTSLKRQTDRYNPAPIFIAMVYAGLGDKEQAMVWLERGYAERDPQLPFMLFDPYLSSLRSDARFQLLLSKYRIPS